MITRTSMKILIIILAGAFWLTTLSGKSQNAPITTAASILAPGPALNVPVTVTDFNDIGSVSLTLDYDISVLTATGFIANPSLPGFIADVTSIPGRIVMSWFGMSGVTLTDNSVMVELQFTGLTDGETTLTWLDDGISGEYSKFDGGEYNLLNDLPTNNFYINGLITHHRDAPVTIAPVFTATPNTSVCIPIKVVGFTDIGSASLSLSYNPAVLTFQSYYSNTISTSWFWQVSADNPGTMVMGGFGTVFSLPDTSILFYACFQYHGGTTPLEWFDDDGSTCEYSDEEYEPLYDMPQPVFYIDGLITETVVVDFMANDLAPPKNTTVTLTDLSQFGPITSWNWSFSPNTVVFVNGTTSSDQSPQVQFTEGGLYTVTLTASNPYSTDTEIKTNYIRAGIPGLWIGMTSENWLTATNWDNHLVPDNLTNVVITTVTSPAFWPKYSGNLVLGDAPADQCSSITFEGVGFNLTILGALINNSGSMIDVAGGSYGNITFE
jgi:PKD repeat protein